MHKYILKQVTKILVLLFCFPIGLHYLARTNSYEKTKNPQEQKIERVCTDELHLFEFEVVD